MARSTESITVRVKREVQEAINREAASRGLTRNEMLAVLFTEIYANGREATTQGERK